MVRTGIVLLGTFFLLIGGPPAAQWAADPTYECVQLSEWTGSGRRFVDLATSRVFIPHPPRAVANFYAPPLSPDGRYYARQSSLDEKNGLHLVNARGDTLLLIDEHVVDSYGWTPDSKWLGYAKWMSIGKVAAFAFSVQTHERIALPVHGDYIVNYEWSPDGAHVALLTEEHSPVEKARLYIVSVPDFSLVRSIDLSTNYVLDGDISWSSSGKEFVLNSVGNGVMLFSLATTDVATLKAASNGAPYHVKWSPTEKYIVVYVSSSDWTVDIDTFTDRGIPILSGITLAARDYGSTPIMDWVTETALLAQEWTQMGIDDLVLIDLGAGQKRTIQPSISYYRLAPNKQSAAVSLRDAEDSRIRMFRFGDFTAASQIKAIAREAYADFNWSADSQRLIVFYDDGSLESYSIADGKVVQRFSEALSLPSRANVAWVDCGAAR
jgi:hypothetical protein